MKRALIQLCEETNQLIEAVDSVLPDLEHYVSTHGPGPDVRLRKLKRMLEIITGDNYLSLEESAESEADHRNDCNRDLELERGE